MGGGGIAGERQFHLAAAAEHGAVQRRVGPRCLQERGELFGQQQELVVEHYEYVVLLEAGPGRAGSGSDLVDDQSRAAGQRELLAQDRRSPGEPEAELIRVGLGCGSEFPDGLNVRPTLAAERWVDQVAGDAARICRLGAEARQDADHENGRRQTGHDGGTGRVAVHGSMRTRE
jgi:hypothetical protein